MYLISCANKLCCPFRFFFPTLEAANCASQFIPLTRSRLNCIAHLRILWLYVIISSPKGRSWWSSGRSRTRADGCEQDVWPPRKPRQNIKSDTLYMLYVKVCQSECVWVSFSFPLARLVLLFVFFFCASLVCISSFLCLGLMRRGARYGFRINVFVEYPREEAHEVQCSSAAARHSVCVWMCVEYVNGSLKWSLYLPRDICLRTAVPNRTGRETWGVCGCNRVVRYDIIRVSG